MKVYRVIPDSFSTMPRLDSKNLTGVEDIYYEMGYTSFLGKRGYHRYNNICENINEEGKYFYLFPEDAIKEGRYLMTGFHRLNMCTFKIVEYDIPEDMILKNIGYGDYTISFNPWYITECYIEKSDLGDEIITTTDISNEDKLENLVNSLSIFLKTINEYNYCGVWSDIGYYSEIFKTDDLSSIINNKDIIKKIILNSSFYETFIKEDGVLIKSPYITGKIIPINFRYIADELDGWENATDYFQQLGIRYDVSKEQDNFKKEIINWVKEKEKKDKEKIKILLKEKNYI